MPDPAGIEYVYGVTRSRERPSIRVPGVAGSPVRAVCRADLAALVTRLDRPLAATAQDVRAHWQVLLETMEQTAILPMRFGVMMDNDQAVREMLLAQNRARLAARLDDLHGMVQVTVKGRYNQDLILAHIASSPHLVRLRDRVRASPGGGTLLQQIQLGELVVSELARQRELDAAEALAALEPASAGARVEIATGDDAAFNLSFLVASDRRRRFDRAVGRLRARCLPRIEIRYLGPLPPFSFVDADLSDGVMAWA